MRTEAFEVVWCKTIPKPLEQGKLYISEEYGCSIHLCACGQCGWETVLPIGGPIGWDMTKNGDLVSFSPSVGCFQHPCKSHYYIKDSKVIWC